MLLHSLLEQGVVVLTASRRLAHALRLQFAQHEQHAGKSVWPTPRVMPWSAWLRQQRLEARATQSFSIETRLLTPAQSRVLWEDVVANSHWGRELLVPANAARLAARSWQRLHDYLIPLDRLREFDSPEAHALHDWCLEFIRRCETLNATDDVRLTHWMHSSEFVPNDRLALAGFDLIPPAVTRLIDRWRAADRVVETPPSSTMSQAVEVVAAADRESEIQLAAQWARSHVEQGTRSVGVIVGDLQSRREEVRRVFEDAFAPGLRHVRTAAASIPVVIAAPAPLASYPLIDAALLALRLAVGESDSTTAGRLLRTPFIAGGESERGRRALADVRLREEQRDRWDWFEIERWAGVTACEQLALTARDVGTRLRSGWTAAVPSEWAERFQVLLSQVGWPGERALTSVEHQTLNKFQDSLAEFGALDAVIPRMNSRLAISRFQELLRDTPFEPEATNGAVIVIDAMTSAGMEFDALWIVGMQADRVPAPATPDALIPLDLQRAAGVPESTPAGTLQLATLQLERWLRSGRSVTLSWPEREGDAELSVSPLIAHLPQVAANTLPAVSLRQQIYAARPSLESIVDDRAPALVAGAARGGAAILELQSRCPFKAQAQLRLHADPVPRISMGVSAPDRGAILHRVLEEIWGALRSHAALIEIPNDVLEAQVREAAQRLAMAELRPDTRVRERLASLEVGSTVRQLMQVLAIEKQRPPFTVRFAEAAERYEIGGLTITLRPDRIDELSAGGELLIDYKLGDANRPRDWLDIWPGRPRRPQLPLYGLAHGEQLRALAFVVLAAGKVEYRGWSDGAHVAPGVDPYPPPKMRLDLADALDWPALLQRWRFTLTRLAEQFVAGEASVDPLPNECDTCHLSTLCRIHEIGNAERGEAGDE